MYIRIPSYNFSGKRLSVKVIIPETPVSRMNDKKVTIAVYGQCAMCLHDRMSTTVMHRFIAKRVIDLTKSAAGLYTAQYPFAL